MKTICKDVLEHVEEDIMNVTVNVEMKLLMYQRSDPDRNISFMQKKTDKRCTCIFYPGEIMWDILKLPAKN
jgi:hypothetical protein